MERDSRVMLVLAHSRCSTKSGHVSPRERSLISEESRRRDRKEQVLLS